MIHSGNGMLNSFVNLFPQRIRGSIYLFLDVVGVILFIQGALSLITGRELVRSSAAWLLDNTPTAVASALGLLGYSIDFIVSWWRAIVHQPIHWLVAHAGIELSGAAIDILVITGMFSTVALKYVLTRRNISRMLADIKEHLEVEEERFQRDKAASDEQHGHSFDPYFMDRYEECLYLQHMDETQALNDVQQAWRRFLYASTATVVVLLIALSDLLYFLNIVGND